MKSASFLPLVAVAAFAAVAVALVSQHGFDMQPCAWCTLQRLVFLLVGFTAVVAVMRERHAIRTRRKISVLAALCALLSLAGLASALYQHFVAAKSDSCALTLADRVIKSVSLDSIAPWLFKATAFCHEANVDLLRVPYAMWSALLFIFLAFLSLRSAWRPGR